MLTSMRKPVAKVITFVLFGLLIMSFAVWGIGDIFQGPGRATSVAEVGTIAIDQQDFSRDLRQELNRLQNQFGSRFDIDQARSLGLVDQVLQQMVSRALFDQQAVDLGMAVTEEQIRQSIAQERAFQNQFGDFDARRFEQVLRGLGVSEGGYVTMLSRDIQRQQIASALGAVAVAPEQLAERIFTYSEERRSAESILIDTAAFTDLGTPGEDDLKTLHEEFSSQFMTPETRSLSLVHLKAGDLANEIAISEDEVRAEFEARAEDYRIPEQREIEQIVLDSQEAAEAARNRLDEGTDFAALAQELTGAVPISLGQLTSEELALQAPELAEGAFAIAEGSVSQPIESGFGWHLVRVTGITPGQDPDFVAARDEIRDELAMTMAVDSLVSIANQLDDELAGGANLEEAASRLDLPLQEIGAIDAQGRDASGGVIDGLPPIDEFLPVLAETAVGEESLLTETRDGDYFVLRVDGVVPAEPMPLDAVREEVAELWRARSRERLAEERADALAARAKEGVALSKIAEDEGLSVTRRGPVNRFGQGDDGSRMSGDLVSKLFELKQGDVAVAQDDPGFLVIKLVEVVQPKPSDRPDAFSTIEERLATELNDDILSSFSLALRQTHNVTLNSVLIEEVLNRF